MKLESLIGTTLVGRPVRGFNVAHHVGFAAELHRCVESTSPATFAARCPAWHWLRLVAALPGRERLAHRHWLWQELDRCEKTDYAEGLR